MLVLGLMGKTYGLLVVPKVYFADLKDFSGTLCFKFDIDRIVEVLLLKNVYKAPGEFQSGFLFSFLINGY